MKNLFQMFDVLKRENRLDFFYKLYVIPTFLVHKRFAFERNYYNSSPAPRELDNGTGTCCWGWGTFGDLATPHWYLA